VDIIKNIKDIDVKIKKIDLNDFLLFEKTENLKNRSQLSISILQNENENFDKILTEIDYKFNYENKPYQLNLTFVGLINLKEAINRQINPTELISLLKEMSNDLDDKINKLNKVLDVDLTYISKIIEKKVN
jgi:hypothetical protein